MAMQDAAGNIITAKMLCAGHADRPAAPSADIDAMLKVMVDRFLGWKLPQDFGPDAGISFAPHATQTHDSPYWPSGTNLLHAGQALEMFKHCLPVDLIVPELVATEQPEQSHCSDERPCIPCFTDNGKCEEAPAAPDHQCCGKCKQEDVGQTGEHPCSDCGLPLVHDAEPAKYTELEQRLAVDLQTAQHLLAVAVKMLGGVLEVSADDAIGLETAVLVGETDISTGNYVLKMTHQAPQVPQ